MDHQWDGMHPKSIQYLNRVLKDIYQNVTYERNWTVESKGILHFLYVELYLCNCLHIEGILASYWHSNPSTHTKYTHLVFCYDMSKHKQEPK